MKKVILFFAVVIAAVSCQTDEMVIDAPGTAPQMAEFDWSSLGDGGLTGKGACAISDEYKVILVNGENGLATLIFEKGDHDYGKNWYKLKGVPVGYPTDLTWGEFFDDHIRFITADPSGWTNEQEQDVGFNVVSSKVSELECGRTRYEVKSNEVEKAWSSNGDIFTETSFEIGTFKSLAGIAFETDGEWLDIGEFGVQLCDPRNGSEAYLQAGDLILGLNGSILWFRPSGAPNHYTYYTQGTSTDYVVAAAIYDPASPNVVQLILPTEEPTLMPPKTILTGDVSDVYAQALPYNCDGDGYVAHGLTYGKTAVTGEVNAIGSVGDLVIVTAKATN